MALDVNALLQTFADKNASDLYVTVGSPPCMRLENSMERIGADPLKEEDVRAFLNVLLSEEAVSEFDATLEYNTAIDWQGKVRMRINVFRQRQHSGVVIRRIKNDIPPLQALGLPMIFSDIIMEKRGLVLVVGPTGSGKSTTLASMVGYRNLHGSGHIVTIEDPIEFIHDHKNCIITQRDVGIDTYSFGIGLKNALRQMPDVIVIGEVRDREAMEQAIVFAETGHLCLATLHANNAHQAIERIINFFPEERHRQILQNLSFNLKAVMSQRLVRNVQGGRSLAIEVMLNEGLIRALIAEGRIKEIKEHIENGKASGMQTFEQSLLDLYARSIITEEVAMAEADSPANLRVAMKQLPGIRKLKVSDNIQQDLDALNNNQF